MFKRKLVALKHHDPDKFNINDPAHFRAAIAWLEDQHIRHYRVEDRANLRDLKSPDWPKSFQKYLSDLECPLDQNDNAGVLDWLLGWAVHLEYGENSKLYAEATANKIDEKASVPRVVAANPLDTLPFNSDEFKAGVYDLAKALNIAKHPDHLITLKAVCKVISERLSVEVLRNPNEHIIDGKPFPLQECDLGFETGDYVLNQAAKIMRLLFIRDIRDLQTKINEVIVAIQSITANPKTDSSLGKVGK